MCATELPGECFEVVGGEWSVGMGFLSVRWIIAIRFEHSCVSDLLCWLVSHPSITGDSPELVVCSLAFLQGSLPWVSALFPRRTNVLLESCAERVAI